MAKIVCILCVLLVAASGSAVAARAAPSATPLEPEGAPVLREVRRADGGLNHCVVDQAYGNGMRLNLARSVDGRMNLGIVAPRAIYDPGTSYPVRLELGTAPMRVTKARAVDATMLLIDLEKDAEFAPQLLQARALAVVGRTDRMEFSVPQAAAMLAQLEQCAAARDLVLPPSLRELLHAAGLGGSVAVDPGATPDGHTFADYVWRFGALTGGARQRELSRAVDFAGIVKAQLAVLKERCRGVWREDATELVSFGAARQQRAVLTCAREQDGAAMGILFHQAADGKLSIISHAGVLTDKENIRAVTVRLAEVLAKGAERKAQE
ncbi:MAG: hypothetical protein WBK91_08575 [Alphaproteobacteria bacterium]